MVTFETLQEFAISHPWALAASVAIAAGTAAYLQSPHYKLRHIPSVGSSSWPLLSYFGARRYFKHSQEYFQEGYERYNGKMFKVATMDQYIIIATGRTLVRELANLPDDKMSFMDAVNELTQQKYVIPEKMLGESSHIDIVKRDLTRNLTVLFPEIYDEIELAFEEYIPKTDDWSAHSAINVAMMVVARASNRVLIGLPYCRHTEYLENAVRYTQDWAESTRRVAQYPGFLKPLVAPFVNKLPATIKRVGEIVAPEIDRRRALMDEHGKDYPNKNNDFLTWMMDQTYGDPEQNSTTNLAYRLLAINFAAIHTSSSTFTHALYTLAANPQWAQPLREEIEQVVEAEGMTKAAMQKMIKLDSFFRESNRRHTIAGMTMNRMALKPHLFSDGTYVPAGSILGVPSMPHQLDAANYSNPDTMDPTRFEHAKDGEATRKYFTSVDSEYLGFGIGKHACPGRFFAGNELKAMMAHLLLKYDIRAEVEGVRPPNSNVGQSIMPNMAAKVLFRKRQT